MASLACIAVEGITLGFLDLFIRNPTLKKIFNVQYFHRHITSDIPGNPHVFDDVLISLYNTLPEPSNFNMVWTNVYYNEAIIIRGRVPPARINSLTAYTRPGGANYPCSVDLASIIDSNGRFEVFIARADDNRVTCPAGMHRLTSADWERGFICMRNYCVPPGTVYETPEIVRASDDKVIRKTETLIAGPANLSKVFWKNMKFKILCRIIVFGILKLVNGYLFRNKFDANQKFNSFWTTVLALLLSTFMSALLTRLLYRSGRKRLYRQTNFCTENNKLYLPDEDQAANGSQPCTLHKYWIMRYDIPRGSTLSLTGVINPADQKYWSFVIYDEDGVSLPQYAHDMSARKGPVHRASSDNIPDDADAYSFNIHFINDDPPKRPHKVALSDPLVTKVYIPKKNARGYIMFRRVHPSFTLNPDGSELIVPRALRVPQAILLNNSKNKSD